MNKKIKILLSILAIFIALIFLFYPFNEPDDRGINYNELRISNNGIPLKEYLNHVMVYTDKDGYGKSLFIIEEEKEDEFMKKKTAYLVSKFIHFNSSGIFQEKNIIRKEINDSSHWFINTSNIYSKKKINGFLAKVVNNVHQDETKVNLTVSIRDSIFDSWDF